MIYTVYKGEYPFNEQLGTVEAPANQPEVALKIALKIHGEHVVVEGDNSEQSYYQ